MGSARGCELDTIAAPASAVGAADRAILRVSGAGAQAIVAKSCSAQGTRFEPSVRGAFEVEFHDGEGVQPALLLWMPGPRSFTAEDVAELHLCGHPALLELALQRLLRTGARLAEPGEFTRRAFENGRIDLAQAEGVAALVSARTESERRAALALLAGGLGERLADVRDGLDALRALAEASLDFDEADTGHVPTEDLAARTKAVIEGLDEALRWERQRTRDAADLVVCLAGAPNAGKSTLFNRLAKGARRDAAGPALVSDVAGTTRDPARGRWVIAADHGGAATAELVDTAGLFGDGMSPGELDARAVERAHAELEAADLVVLVVDATDPGATTLDAVRSGRTLLVWNKVDAPSAAAAPPEALLGELKRAAAGVDVPWVALSGATGDGIPALAQRCLALLVEQDGQGASGADGAGASARAGLAARHVEALQRAAEASREAQVGIHGASPLDLVAEDLRDASESLDEISGRTTPEDLLSRIFARFCLGK